MKKILALSIVLLLVCLTAAGCTLIRPKNSATEAATSAPTAPVIAEPTLAPVEAVTSAPVDTTPNGDKKYATVEEYIASDEMKENIASIESAGGDTMTIKVYAEGSSMVYDYMFTETYDAATVAVMKTSLDTSLDTGAETYETTASVIQEQVEEEDVSVTIIYRNGDGSVITQKTFEQ